MLYAVELPRWRMQAYTMNIAFLLPFITQTSQNLSFYLVAKMTLFIILLFIAIAQFAHFGRGEGTLEMSWAESPLGPDGPWQAVLITFSYVSSE